MKNKKVNHLKIFSGSVAFRGSKILLNGMEFPVTSIKIEGNVSRGTWKCKAEFYPKSGINLNVKVKKIKRKDAGKYEGTQTT